MVIILLLSAVLLCLVVPGLSSKLKVVHYELTAGDAAPPVRAALVTDLHSCAYGQNQQELLDAVDAAEPDFILMSGDIFDDTLQDANSFIFLQGIAGKYPCFYVPGNHELRRDGRAFQELMSRVDELGITRVNGTSAVVEINGRRLCICGVDDPSAWVANRKGNINVNSGFRAQLAEIASLAEKRDAYVILLSHRPELFELYCQYPFDLVVSGHAHGGQWRIPGLLNGLLAPNQGLFPKHAGGRYEKNGTVMIVSRGLARESTWIPRFYNRPELVVIDLKGKT